MPPRRLRLDAELVRRGLAPSRERAAQLIADGRVRVSGATATKPATGVTTGAMLKGVRFKGDIIETETVVMRSVTGTVRWIRAEHRQLEKFHLD